MGCAGRAESVAGGTATDGDEWGSLDDSAMLKAKNVKYVAPPMQMLVKTAPTPKLYAAS